MGVERIIVLVTILHEARFLGPADATAELKQRIFESFNECKVLELAQPGQGVVKDLGRELVLANVLTASAADLAKGKVIRLRLPPDRKRFLKVEGSIGVLVVRNVPGQALAQDNDVAKSFGVHGLIHVAFVINGTGVVS